MYTKELKLSKSIESVYFFRVQRNVLNLRSSTDLKKNLSPMHFPCEIYREKHVREVKPDLIFHAFLYLLMDRKLKVKFN